MIDHDDREAIRALVADRIVAELRAECGGSFEEFAVVPLSFVGPLVGLSVKQAGRVLPVTSFGPRSNGVTLAALRRRIVSQTQPPKSSSLQTSKAS